MQETDCFPKDLEDMSPLVQEGFRLMALDHERKVNELLIEGMIK